MKALTLIQPWATAVAVWGKDVENRTWTPPLDLLGQRIAIHAGNKVDLDGFSLFVMGAGINQRGMVFDKLPRGAVVATARLAGWVAGDVDGIFAGAGKSSAEVRRSPWFVGPWGWVLTDVRQLAESVPCRGRQRLWNLPADVEARVLEQELKR